MDLVLVNPGNRKRLYQNLRSTMTGIEPPLYAAVIAARAREKGFSVAIIDAEAMNLGPEETAEEIIRRDPILVGMIAYGANPSASTMNMAGASAILRALRERAPELKTIIQGTHPSALPERTLREEPVDFVCQGEGYYTFLELLEELKSGKRDDFTASGLHYLRGEEIVKTATAPLVENLEELPMAAWDLLPMEKYRAHNWHCFDHIEARQPYAVIYTTQGCPFTCTFCCINAPFGGASIRYRSPENVVREIDHLATRYGVRNLKIIDEMFVLKQSHVIELCDRIIAGGYDLNIWAYARVDTVNQELLKKLRAAGFRWLAYGIESGSKKVRSTAAKRFTQEKIYQSVELTRAAGIHTIGNYIFGLPEDDRETMQETLDLAIDLNCEFANFYVAMAYPGSALYDQAVKDGIRLPETWAGYSQHAEDTLPLSTQFLTAGEVVSFRDQAFETYYRNPRYLELVRSKFGQKVVDHLGEMLAFKIRRKYTAESMAAARG